MALGLLKACHPAPTAAVTTIAVLLGWSLALTATQLALVAVTVLVGQLSIGWSNDWVDAARDSAAGRRDKPVVAGVVGTASLRRAALVAGVVSIPLSLAAGRVAGLCHLLLVGAGWSYNVWLKQSRLSPLAYLIGFGALPAYVSFTGGDEPPLWLVAAGALLGVAAHFANAAPDIAQDRALGVWGAPQRLGERASLVISMLCLGLAGAALVAQLNDGWPMAAGAVVVAAPVAIAAACLALGRVAVVFRLVMMAALADVVLLLVAA